VVKPTQITASDRRSIDLYPCKVNPKYTEEGRPSAVSTPTRQFPTSHSLGSDATYSGTQLSGGSNPTSPDSHTIPRVASPSGRSTRIHAYALIKVNLDGDCVHISKLTYLTRGCV
jgi:hypothetical protein